MAIGSNDIPNMFSPIGLIMNLWANNKLDKLKENIALQESAGMLSMKTFWNAIIAMLEIDEGKFYEATVRIEKTLVWIAQSDGLFYAAEIYRLLGVCHFSLKNYELGLKHMQEAKSIALNQGAKQMLNKVNKTIAELSRKQILTSELI